MMTVVLYYYGVLNILPLLDEFDLIGYSSTYDSHLVTVESYGVVQRRDLQPSFEVTTSPPPVMHFRCLAPGLHLWLLAEPRGHMTVIYNTFARS